LRLEPSLRRRQTHPVSIYGACNDDAGGSVLLAAFGAGARALARTLGAPLPVAGEAGPAALGASCGFVVEDAERCDDGVAGVAELSAATGLRSFAQVPMGSAHAPLGALLVGRSRPLGEDAGR
jgi:hypothetical protein